MEKESICNLCGNEMTPCKNCKNKNIKICLSCRDEAMKKFREGIKILQAELEATMQMTIYKPED